MRSELDGGEDSRGTVGATYDAQRSRLLGSEAKQQGHQQHGEDAGLGRSAEDGQLEVAQHGAEVGQRTHSHEDDGREQAALDERVVEVIHQAKVVGNLVQWHGVDVLAYEHSVLHELDHAFTVGLGHTHATPGEVGNENAESDRHEQERFVLLTIPRYSSTKAKRYMTRKRGFSPMAENAVML